MTLDYSSSDSANASLLDTVANPVRLHVMERLDSTCGALTVDDLAESAAEELVDGSAVQRDYTRYRVALAHVHLPKLAAADLVEYDTDTDTVVVGDSFASVADIRRAWDRFLTDVERTTGGLT